VVKTLRAPEAIGGWAHIALFERMWGLHAYAAPSHRVETSGGGVYHLDRRGRKCELEGCVAEARATGGFCLNRRSAYTPWSPWRLPSAAYRLAEYAERSRSGHHRIAKETVKAMEGIRAREAALHPAKG
jgi:hypothetical protein